MVSDLTGIAQYQTTTIDPYKPQLASTDSATLSSNYDTFIKLLTTQLQNQDPTSPTDSNEFTKQLVQYSQVEQQIKTNDNLSTLISAQSANSNIALLGYIGKEVETAGGNFTLQNGQGHFTYTPTDPSINLTINIKNSSGNIVRSVPGSTSLTTHDYKWDGKGNNGNDLPEGSYTASISGTKSDGSAVKSTLTGFSVVDGVRNDASGAVLNAGSVSINSADVLSVSVPKKTTAL